jgi:PAS domain S-box-containing protein
VADSRVGLHYKTQAKRERWPGRILLLPAAGLVILTSAAVNVSGQLPVQRPSHRVLVLYSDERLVPANIIVDEAIRATFTADTSQRIELYSEFLDGVRFPGQAQRQRQREFLREKYRERPPDLVMAIGGGALAFLTERPSDLFRGVPIAYCSIAGDPRPEHLTDTRIADIPVPDSAIPTLEMILRLHPDVRHVAVVSGSGPRDLQYAMSLRGMSTFGDRIDLRWLTNISIDQLRGELSRLPDHTVVLYLTMFQDSSGETFTPRRALEEFAPASRVPIYGYYETYVGHGVVGGSIVTFEEIGQKSAQVGLRILAGESVQAAAQSEAYRPMPMFDWRQLQRWKISEQQLPPGSIIRFKETTFWEQYHWIIVVALSVCILELLLIAALFAQLRRRRLAEASLRENEQRMSLAVDSANLGIWIRDLARKEIWASAKWRELFSFTSSEPLVLERILQRLHRDDRDALEHAFTKAIEGGGSYETEFRLMLPDGGLRWISTHSRVETGVNGQPVRIRGASLDITARKRFEQETQLLRQQVTHVGRISMMGQLASSLAHEINQPLGAILRNAEAAELFLQSSSPDLDEIRAIVSDIRKDDERAGSIIDRMRGLLKRQDLDMRSLDVGELVSEVLGLVKADAAARQVKLDGAVPGDLPPVRGDRVHIQQVLVNLIVNGMDAVDEARRADRRVSVSALLDRSQSVEIAVRDTGDGIPDDRLASIFDPFFTTKSNGLGMGLPISRTIIEAHGGRFWAENNTGGGATFRFTLPIAKEAGAK